MARMTSGYGSYSAYISNESLSGQATPPSHQLQ